MRNLTERSVVKQRLAKLQTGTPPRRRSAPPQHATAPAYLPRKESALVQPPALAIPEDSETNSIIDSYCDSPSSSRRLGPHSPGSFMSPATTILTSASPLPTSTAVDFEDDTMARANFVQPMIDALELHTLNQHNQATELDAQMVNLMAEVQRLAGGVEKTLARPTDAKETMVELAEEVKTRLSSVECAIRGMEGKIDAVAERAGQEGREGVLDEPKAPRPSRGHGAHMIGEPLAAEISRLTQRVADLDDGVKKNFEVVLARVGETHRVVGDSPIDLRKVLGKLDDLVAVQTRGITERSTTRPITEPNAIQQEADAIQQEAGSMYTLPSVRFLTLFAIQLQGIKNLLEEERERQKSHVEQQGDNARYLGELNTVHLP